MTPTNGWKGGPKSGKAFEAEFGRAMSDLDECWCNNSNDQTALNDFKFTWRGMSGLAELKKTSHDRLLFSAVNAKQHGHLLSHAAAGGLSFVAIKRTWPNKSRVWLVRWDHYLQLKGERNSILLEDGHRSEMLYELGRVDADNGGRVWDPVPFFEDWLYDVFLPNLETDRSWR